MIPARGRKVHTHRDGVGLTTVRAATQPLSPNDKIVISSYASPVPP